MNANLHVSTTEFPIYQQQKLTMASLTVPSHSILKLLFHSKHRGGKCSGRIFLPHIVVVVTLSQEGCVLGILATLVL